jgi:pimeloyl-ACP methyl ester carboxylesterase
MQTIDEGTFVNVNGAEHWLTIRGADRSRPAVLVLGGPGLGYAALAPFFAPWERELTLVQWDQPGAGFTFARNGFEPTSIARLVDDGLGVAELVAERLGVRKLVLLCFSGGTIAGLQMVKRRPELFSAYVGNGQVVDWARQDARSYDLLLGRARERGDAAMHAELLRIGPPPYPDTATDAVKSKYAGAPTPRESPGLALLGTAIAAAVQGLPAGAAYLAPGLKWPEPMARTFAAYTALRSEIVTFDARRLGRELAVPLWFLQGAEDVFTVTAEVERYAVELVAPHAEVVKIAGAGHGAMLLRDDLLAALREHVLPKLAAS